MRTLALGLCLAAPLALQGKEPDAPAVLSMVTSLKAAQTEGRADAPIRYFCAACDVKWSTRLRTPSWL
jgi:hypothetical protein